MYYLSKPLKITIDNAFLTLKMSKSRYKAIVSRFYVIELYESALFPTRLLSEGLFLRSSLA